MNKVQIIAEAGVNHNGNENLAIDLIDAAVSSGADVIKFQTFITEQLVSKEAIQAEYQEINSKQKETQYNMLKKLELSYPAFSRLQEYSQKKGIRFLSTAFDSKSLRFLTEELKLDTLKIASGELTNAPLMLEHARTKKNIILSTGMATLEEIKQTLEVFAFGFMSNSREAPTIDGFKDSYDSIAGAEAVKEKVTIMHCTTQYPTPHEAINLNAIDLLRDKFNLKVGFSDHSDSVIVPSLAVVKGVTVIEKHLTLDNLMEGPDHLASLSPSRFREMVENIRLAELSLGAYEKKPSKGELKNKSVSRKSIHASKGLKKGELFSETNIVIKRPETGISPYNYWNLLGTKASKDYNGGDLIDE